MKNVVLSLVGLLMFVGCDIESPTRSSSQTYSYEWDYNPYNSCETETTWQQGLNNCCCIESATNYSKYGENEWDYDCNPSDSTYCNFE